jgi:hypothetical protein
MVVLKVETWEKAGEKWQAIKTGLVSGRRAGDRKKKVTAAERAARKAWKRQ